MPDRRDFLKLLGGALGLGALGGAVVDILTTKPIIKPAEAPQQVVQPYYSVMVQTPQGPMGLGPWLSQPMVKSSLMRMAE